MKWFNLETRYFWLFGIRFLFGLWLLWAGLYKWVAIGPNTFIGFITAEFDKTWSPHLLNVFLSWVILAAEPVLAALILYGKKPRLVWTLTALFMFMLTFGQTILMKPDVIANWQYTILALVCAALSEPFARKSETGH
ncbi:MAG: hypothetical protein ACREBV_08375 [Candidatus Zixiibacteriota bacterium]